MKIAVVGGGPAGLYFSYLWKSRHQKDDVVLFELGSADATWGFGVVFSDEALGFIGAGDAGTVEAIEPRMERWPGITLNLRGEQVVIDGIGFSAIGRLSLLKILHQRAREAGVACHFQTHIDAVAGLGGYDLIVGADGLNSIVRRGFEADFGTSITYSRNKFAWYGTPKRFETLSQTFIETDLGNFNAHHYRYAPAMSTFLVECDPGTWTRYGFADKTIEESKAILERVFSIALEGQPLLSNKSVWRNFPWVWNERWSFKNMVLIGDALHTAHFSIGSGTRLALEDAIALAKALEASPGDIPGALVAYEQAREPVVKKLVQAARSSAAWYEQFPEHMKRDPVDFAFSYITRSGRIDMERLTRMSPRFMARYGRWKSAVPDASAPSREVYPAPIADRVPPGAPGSVEIGFAIPDRYNASRILFDNLAAGRGAKDCLIGPGGRRSYEELCREAAKWGHGFRALGLKPGDRILMFLDDTPVYPAAFFGAVRAGFVPLLINTLTPPDLLQFYLADSQASVAVADAEFSPRFNHAACEGTRLRTLIVANGVAQENAVLDVRSAGTWLDPFPDVLEEAPAHRNDMAFWMYSSGSTGRPKGIVHLQHDMAYSNQSYARHLLRLSPEDICFSVPKMFFAYGFGNSVTFPFSAGAAALLLPGQPKPQAIFEAISTFKPTVFFGLPTLYTSLIKADGAGSCDFSSLRLAVSAAEVLSAEVFGEWKSLTGLEIMEGLGSTEALHIYLSNTEARKKPGSAGMRVPGYELELKSAGGSAVPDGEEGILWVRGDSNAPAYWNRPDKTAETMREDGWIYTGDRFVRDGDGFYFFRGRADDLVKISGQWVYPLEVELCLLGHPDVLECAVFALELPDRRMTLKAATVMKAEVFDPAATTSALQDYVKARLLPYKYPREIDYYNDLPKTGTGKLDRQALIRAASMKAAVTEGAPDSSQPGSPSGTGSGR
jgi:benzoate-CoA ligase family protein